MKLGPAGPRALAWTLLGLALHPASAPALDLATVMARLGDHPRLEARRAMVEAARRQVGPEGAWAAPMLELGVTNVPVNGRFDEDPMTMKVVGLSQRVTPWGARGLARRSATERVNVASSERDEAAFELLGEAFEAYAEAHAAGRLAHMAREHGVLLDAISKATRSRYEAGRGRLDDLLRVEAERARLIADTARYQGESRIARARLTALTGIEIGHHDTLAPPPVAVVPAESEAWLAAIGADHPRIRGAEAEVRRYRLSARSARRMAWPEVELRGEYGFREELRSAAAHVNDDMFSVMVGVMLPIFAGQSQLSEAAAMDAMARSAQAERANRERELRQQVMAAHAEAHAAQRSAALRDTVLQVQRRALQASFAAYESGIVDLARTLESAHSFYMDEVEQVRAETERARAQAMLLALTGRGDLVGVRVPSIERGAR